MSTNKRAERAVPGIALPNGQSARPWEPTVAGQVLRVDVDQDDGSGVSPFPPIADYAFLSDCDVTALVAPSGNVEWMCLPRMDSPSVFGAVLDRGAGGFRFGPTDVTVPAARRYLPGTMVLETSWSSDGGWVIVRDVLLIGPWHHEAVSGGEHRRAPTDYEAEHTLLRTVRCVNGEVQLTLDCEPAFDYGHERAQWRYTDHGYFQGVATAKGVGPPLTLKGLTYANTGALVAAATTSLPETPGGERNWDYRFSWIRDSSLTLWALYT